MHWKEQFDQIYPSLYINPADDTDKRKVKAFIQTEIVEKHLSDIECDKHPDQLCGGCKDCEKYQQLRKEWL